MQLVANGKEIVALIVEGVVEANLSLRGTRQQIWLDLLLDFQNFGFVDDSVAAHRDVAFVDAIDCVDRS